MRLFLIILLLFSNSAYANFEEKDYASFAHFPVLDGGRVKPLDAFARNYLILVNGKDHLKDMSATKWLAELLFNPKEAYNRHIFNIQNPDVVNVLELDKRKGHRYSFFELTTAFGKNIQTISPLFNLKPTELTLAQKQLVELYNNFSAIADISKSLSIISPLFEITEKKIASIFQAKVGDKLNFLQVMPKRQELTKLAGINDDEILQKPLDPSARHKLSEHEVEAISFLFKLRLIEGDRSTNIFKTVPIPKKAEWLSLWQAYNFSMNNGDAKKIQDAWEFAYKAYNHPDSIGWNEATGRIQGLIENLVVKISDRDKLKLEVYYYKWDLFSKSIALYGASLLVLVLSLWLRFKFIWQASFALLALGFVTHLAGIGLRMYIMGRPPVSNLYASIIFVSLICVLIGIILEWRKRNGVGIAASGTIGFFLQLLGMKYATEGDTMGVVVAVLDTNFWLGTHVVAITIGYSATILAAVLAHIYLLKGIKHPLNDDVALFKQIHLVSIVAIFFSALGTILGGIWADQSWGRFWGWDPKENGALLVVLWLAWATHGRVSGIFKELGFATVIALGNIIIAIAWFGVNLLNVGLHSYGFTSGAAINLGMFSLVEIIFCLICNLFIRRRNVLAQKQV